MQGYIQRPVVQNSVTYEINLFTTYYLGDIVKEKDVDGTCNYTCDKRNLYKIFGQSTEKRPPGGLGIDDIIL